MRGKIVVHEGETKSLEVHVIVGVIVPPESGRQTLRPVVLLSERSLDRSKGETRLSFQQHRRHHLHIASSP